MPAGDSQRTWFPEMLSELTVTWNPQMSWKECTDLCHKMTLFRESIWKNRDIKPAKRWCPNCQEYHYSRPAPVSIRSLLFALKKIKAIDDKKLKDLDKSWKKYRKTFNLDAYGEPA